MDTFLGILLFIICLSTLIMIHEAGHLIAAKAFKVYCDDFSLGFGKAFLHKKRKNGETYFSLRVIPFGGFVSMADKEGELRPGLNIPKERTINGIHKVKAGIIMLSGVAMNFVLAFVLILSNNLFFDTKSLYSNCVDVEANSIAETAGVKTSRFEKNKFLDGDLIMYSIDPRNTSPGSRLFYYDVNSYATFDDNTTKPIYAVINEKKVSLSNPYDYDNLFEYYGLTEDLQANYADKVTPLTRNKDDSHIKSITLKPIFYHKEEGKCICTHCFKEMNKEDLIFKDDKYYCPYCDKNYEHSESLMHNIAFSKVSDIVLPIKKEGETTSFEKMGLKMKYVQYKKDVGEAFQSTCVQYGEGASLIFTTLGKLFVGQGWDQTGGIISIYTSSANVLSSMGFGYYLYYWGLISINLGIVNLLPFPGLDGWQTLVLIIEGISRKKVPEKAKSIMSFIGIAILMVLMVALIIKDIIILL